MAILFRKSLKDLLLALIISSFFITSVFASSGGISGYSGQTAGVDCSNCHSSSAGGFPPIPVLTGPVTVDPGSTNTYTLNVDIGEFVAGGLDVSADAGTLVVTDATGTQILNSELTHTTPRQGIGNVSWSFDWTAPGSAGNYVLYVGVAGVDGAQGSNGDLTATTTLTVNVAQGNQAPVAMINAPVTATEGVAVSFDGRGSNDPDGNIAAYEWNFGDGNMGAGDVATHVFLPGNYNVTLTVTDNQGATDTATHNIQINPAATPVPPTAAPGGPYSSIVGTPIQFDGNGSTDSDGQILSYAWDFGDGNTASNVAPTHNYAAVGTYTVSLTVTDNDGLTDTQTTTAEIVALANPVADPGGPYNGTVGIPLQFNGSASNDPDGRIVDHSWDFGDGNFGTGASPSHAYTAPGTYTVVLTVTDNDNLTGTAQTTATIVVIPPQPLPPVANAGGPYTGTTGMGVPFDGSGSNDADGQLVDYAWNFGDGNTGQGVNPNHTYAAPGDYTVTLTVTDNSGLTNTAATTASIGAVTPPPPLQVAPIANAGGPYSGVTGSPIAFDGTGSSDADGTIVSFRWDFGDGNMATGATPTHRYAAAGTYVVILVVTDNVGLSGSTEVPVSVTAAAEPPPPVELNGAQLYGKNCASCHGGNGLGGSSGENVVGARPAEIMAAIQEGEGGMDALRGLTPGEIQAISDWLRRGLADPKDQKKLKKKGNGIYTSYCAACHGKKGTGGKADSVIGEDAEDIMEAIQQVPDMQFLAGLIDGADIAAVVVYLDKGKSRKKERDQEQGDDEDEEEEEDKEENNEQDDD